MRILTQIHNVSVPLLDKEFDDDLNTIPVKGAFNHYL